MEKLKFSLMVLEDYLVHIGFKKTILPWRFENDSYSIIILNNDSYDNIVIMINNKRYDSTSYQGKILSLSHFMLVYESCKEDYNTNMEQLLLLVNLLPITVFENELYIL